MQEYANSGNGQTQVKSMMEMQTWSFKKPNGISKESILDCIAGLLERQKGRHLTIQKIIKHVKSEMELKTRHADLAKLMLEHGAISIGSSQKNRHIFDITDCVLRKRRARKGRSHSRIE
jgi:hypothetical protein